MDANYIQQRMSEIQKSDELSSVMGKIFSGRPGYKAVIEKKVVRVKCSGSGCEMFFENPVKFCPECGTKVEWPKKV